MRQLISSGAMWENIVAYSRAVKTGNVIEVSGTVAVNGENVVGENDMYAQAKFIFEKIEDTLQKGGAEMKHVVRTRMYVTDISLWQQAAQAHAEFFSNIKPATTMVEVNALIDSRFLIEIEATAIIDEEYYKSKSKFFTAGKPSM